LLRDVMNHKKYTEIKNYLGALIKGTEWENHVYAVGGCVRDEIMCHEIKDIDLCVSLPSGGIRFAEWLRKNGYTMKGVAVYPSYGTAMLHLKKFPDVELEFVQTRKEKYIDHSCRNPETAFGSLEDDCMRRDLTINSLYSNVSTGEIVDITGKGVDDIKNHVIRTPNAPDVIYDDDPLRILRCIRFASRYGWKIEKETYDGMVRNVPRLVIITKERVRDELDKMLICAHPVMAMELLRKTGAMRYVIPEHLSSTVWEHTMAVLGNMKSDKLELRMAALLHDIVKSNVADMVDELLRPLKYSNEFIREVAFLVKYHGACKKWGDKCENMHSEDLRKLQYVCQNEERFRDLMLLIDADNNAHNNNKSIQNQVEIVLQRTEEMKAEGTAMFGYKLPVTGNDVMELKSIGPSLEVKQYLDHLMEQAFVSPFKDKEDAIESLKAYFITPLPNTTPSLS